MTAAESRPALPEVLACLVDGDPRMAEFWRAATKPYDGDAKITLRVDATAEGVGTFNVIDGHELRSVARQPWRHASPAEALEALQTAGLAPADDARRRWWCPTCHGTGISDFACPDCTPREGVSCGDRSHPPDLPALVAVASLGVAQWLSAEELARVVEPDAVVVWRAMTREALREHHSRHAEWTSASPAAVAYSREESLMLSDPKLRWPELGGWPHGGVAVARAWPALRALAVTEVVAPDGTRSLVPTGVHLVGHEPGRVTLAVEALG